MVYAATGNKDQPKKEKIGKKEKPNIVLIISILKIISALNLHLEN